MASKNTDNDVVLQSFRLNSPQQDLETKSPPTEKCKRIRNKIPLPLSSCNFLSFTTNHWLSPLVYQIARTVKNGVDEAALWSCAQVDSCQQNGQRLKEIWEKEVKAKGIKHASFLRTCLVFLRPMYLRLVITAFVFAGNLAVLTLVVFRNLLRYLQYGELGPSYGYVLAGCMFVANIVQIFYFGYSWALGHQHGTRLKAAAMYLVYEKLLRIEKVQKNTEGELLTMFTTDAFRLYLTTYRLYLAPMFVTVFAGGMMTLWFLIGWWTIVGVLIFVVMVTLQLVTTIISSKLQRKRLKHTDSRIQMVKEILTNIRLIKMWAWEKPFLKEVVDEREREISKSSTLTFLTTFGQSQIFQAPSIATTVTLLIYSYFGNPLTTELALTVATSLATLRYAVLALPLFGRTVGDFLVSCRRIEAFLLRQEKVVGTGCVTDETLAIEMVNASFHWPLDGDASGPDPLNQKEEKAYSNPVVNTDMHKSDPGFITNFEGYANEVRYNPKDGYALQHITLEAKKGSLIGICGKVGSGKSTLVSALLGQMRKMEGHIAVNGTIAICPQEAWVFNDTIRENITVGNQFDKNRYERCLELTCLKADLQSFPSGDLSEVGDRGITLSGGQRQRVSLARALYSDRDIYILDDPLSALDVTVGRQVFTWCIKDGLKQKTIILITHQLQYLQDCDQVILLDNGMISEKGPHSELMSHGGEYAHLIKSFFENTSSAKGRCEENPAREDEKQQDSRNPDSDAGRLTENESIELGGVSVTSYIAYIRSLGGATVSLIVLFCFLLAEAVSMGSDWWLSAWLQQTDSADNKFVNSSGYNNRTMTSNATEIHGDLTTRVASSLAGVTSLKFDMTRSTFITVYGMGIAVQFLINSLRCWVLAKITVRSSRVFHKRVLEKVMASPVCFFDKTPIGRIMNRFSADIDTLDSYIPMDGGLTLMMCCRILLAVVSIAIILPLMLIAATPLVVMIYITGKFGRAPIRQMKRMDNVSRSDLVDHVTTTIQGLDSIRTYEIESVFTARMKECVDKSCVKYVIHASCVDWQKTRMDIIGACFTLLTVILIVTFRDVITPQLGGLILYTTAQAIALIGPMIQSLCQVEAWFTSVERLQEYIQTLEWEGYQKYVTAFVNSDWPTRGDVMFQNVCMSYDRNSMKVLKNLSFTVTSGQNIGIVGRTGAGKTSLGATLFRLVELSSGNIFIDGVDISQLNLQQLRSRLSIIPQEPVLFAGTLRRNLDPFRTRTEEDIWNALEKSQLKEKVMGLTGRLEYRVENSGENFSVGERQLLCMARALLRNAKILLLDEATANVDTETDSKIQLMVSECFSECTVLIIAHRLNTVQHCDKILVMDDGKVHEFDSPENLQNRSNSLFKYMLDRQIE